MTIRSKTLLFVVLVCINNAYLNAKQAIVVTIVADDNYPPYSYYENGTVAGVYIELIKKAAKLLEPDYQVNIVAMPWKRALMEVENGEAFAILPPYTHLSARPYISPYSVALAQESVVVYCHKDINLQKTLSGSSKNVPLIIGINAGYIILNEEYAQANKKKRLVISENKSTKANLTKLVTRRIDCYANDKLTIELGLEQLSATTQNFLVSDFVQKDFISAQTAHIGYTNKNLDQFPFKNDFIKRMDQALIRVTQMNQ